MLFKYIEIKISKKSCSFKKLSDDDEVFSSPCFCILSYFEIVAVDDVVLSVLEAEDQAQEVLVLDRDHSVLLVVELSECIR